MLKLFEFKEKIKNTGLVRWSRSTTYETFWCFKMASSTQKIWPYLADTSRFNRELGFAPREEHEVDGKLIVKTTTLGLSQEWLEVPWTWLFEKTICAERIYKKGMGKAVQAVFHLEKTEDQGCCVYIYFGWQPRNWVWHLFLKMTEKLILKKFTNTFKKIDSHLHQKNKNSHQNILKQVAPELSLKSKSQLQALKNKLVNENGNLKIFEHLCNYILQADDLDLEPIRVLRLAQSWQIESRDLLVACLQATRAGMLNISWNVVCPHCRGSRFVAMSLGQIPESANCDVCEIDFSTTSEYAIEVVFHVHQSIRVVPEVMFCAAEPAKKNHIKLQQNIMVGENLKILVPQLSGHYRARFLGHKKDYQIHVDSSHRIDDIDLNSIENTHFKANPISAITFTNRSVQPQMLVIEELKWDETLLKPAQVFALQEFRDLFSEEHLNSNVKLTLGEQAILFTDIVGSTRFYNEVGDAKAFAEIRAHFQEVFQEVKNHHGVVIKTIGDAVMASFGTLDDAYLTAVKIQKRFYEGRTDTPIRLRISIHKGPVIAVQLNTGIDYFGSTINLAAKIQSCAGACEVAMAREIFDIFHKSQSNQFSYEYTQRMHSRDILQPIEVCVIKITPDQQNKKSLKIA